MANSIAPIFFTTEGHRAEQNDALVLTLLVKAAGAQGY